MPRTARVVAIGFPHHITQRGNYGQLVFIDDTDRDKYIDCLNEYGSRYKVSFLSDCLMVTHVHLIGVPDREDSLAKTLKAAHMEYSQYFNKKMGTKGHLWHGRFYSCILDENHLVAAVRYIERNPVRAKLVKNPWDWKWSSASVHIGANDYQGLKLGNIFDFVDINQNMWKSYIGKVDQKKDMEEIKKYTFTGRPLGNKQFVENMENRFGKRLVALPVGRPSKK